MTAVVIEDARGPRRIRTEEFPLSLGGPGAGLELPGALPGVAAWLGFSEGELFVQVAADGPSLACNGTPVTTSHWLHAGDVVRVGEARLRIEGAAGSMRVRAERLVAGREESTPIVEVAGPSGGAAIRPTAFHPRLQPGRGGRSRRPRRMPWALLATLLALASAAFWLLAIRHLTVQIEPPPDERALHGGLSMRAPGGGWLLLPGRYRIVASKRGYHPLDEAIEIGAERRQIVAFSLRLLPGRLIVLTPGVESAAWTVDGGPALPVGEPVEVEPGSHDVRVRADRYAEFAAQVTIEGGGAEQTLEAELAPLWSGVRFESEPAGATLRVDGKTIGPTPLTIDLMPGVHRLEMRASGYRTYEDTIRVEANEARAWPRVKLALLPGRFEVRSEPAGATVTVDGEFGGQTPVALELAPDREHRIAVTKAGHEEASRSVALKRGESQEWEVRLQPREGEVAFAVTPGGAELWVDGRRHGSAEGVVRLPAGAHDLEIRKDGFVPYKTSVTPRPGFRQSIEVALDPEGLPASARAPRLIETSRGHRLVLIEPGRFDMGASRREPGRRANETLHPVELTRGFYLGTMEVTNRQFREFQPAHSSGQAGGNNLEIDDRPAVMVAWEDAARYCNWLSEQESLPPAYVEGPAGLVAVRPPTAGYRLPLEAEWARAARYPEGETARKYPWGDSLPVPSGAGNYADISARGILTGVLDYYNDGFPVTSPSGEFAPNPLGIYNLGGNVAEWMHDIYAIPGSGLQVDPLGPAEGDLHVIRGSSWMQSTISELRLTYRDYGKKPRPDLGFRIARNVE